MITQLLLFQRRSPDFISWLGGNYPACGNSASRYTTACWYGMQVPLLPEETNITALLVTITTNCDFLQKKMNNH